MSEASITKSEVRFQVPVGSVWVHVKTQNSYVVTGLAIRESDLSMDVNYRSVKGDHDTIPWSRPVAEFLDGRFKRKL